MRADAAAPAARQVPRSHRRRQRPGQRRRVAAARRSARRTRPHGASLHVRRARASHAGSGLRGGHVGRPGGCDAYGRGDAAAVAAALARSGGVQRQLRQRLQLRVHQHAVLARPTMPLPMEENPRAAFELLFGDTGTTDSAARARRLREAQHPRFGAGKGARLSNSVGAADRVRFDGYLESIRDVERRLKPPKPRARATCPSCSSPPRCRRPSSSARS